MRNIYNVERSTSPMIDHTNVKAKVGRPVLLDCPHCHNFISAENIDLDSALATCGTCSHTFDYSDELVKDPHRRPEIVIPDGVEALKLRSMLEIVVDWYSSAPKRKVLTLVTSAFLWNIVLLPIVLFLTYNGQFFFLFLFAGHLATGLMLVVQLLATFLNKTHIEVRPSGIQVIHKPIKSVLNKNKDIRAADIDQLYVSRYTEKPHDRIKNGVQAYALSLVLKNGKTIELIRGMNRETQLYIEQEIEAYLRIKDRPIKGEIDRNEEAKQS